MAKTKTSGTQKRSSKKSLKKGTRALEPHEVHTPELRDSKLVREILIEALMENDLETFQDVLVAHLRSTSKSRMAARTKLGRQTLYDLIDEKKEFNPTLSTLGVILKNIAA